LIDALFLFLSMLFSPHFVIISLFIQTIFFGNKINQLIISEVETKDTFFGRIFTIFIKFVIFYNDGTGGIGACGIVGGEVEEDIIPGITEEV
jgi:hypothetical protein